MIKLFHNEHISNVEVKEMSMPNIPNITPIISLDSCETINLLLSSIALEEIGLSHILNAEGEKLQHFLSSAPSQLNDLITMNNSINKTLRTIVKSQLMLTLKLEDVIQLAEKLPYSRCNDNNNDPGNGNNGNPNRPSIPKGC